VAQTAIKVELRWRPTRYPDNDQGQDGDNNYAEQLQTLLLKIDLPLTIERALVPAA
jgi:hypothetical protein